MQIYATLLFLSSSTVSFGQTVSASALDVLREELLRESRESKNEALRLIDLEVSKVRDENADLRLELENIRSLLRTQPRRTSDERFLNCINRDISDGENIYFQGCNLHIQSGEGATNTINGKGNLIIGYNEDDYEGYLMEVSKSVEGLKDTEVEKVETIKQDVSGSHNLIIGKANSYGSYGGLVAGYGNRVTGPYSAVSGGYGNDASGYMSSVSGGVYNEASGDYSSVSGGYTNEASGKYSSVSGGVSSEASGVASSVSGGNNNKASGVTSSVSGGAYNVASGASSSISGGKNNKAPGIGSSISGGRMNTAPSWYSSVTGGRKNTASGSHAIVVGGQENEALKKFSVVTGE